MDMHDQPTTPWQVNNTVPVPPTQRPVPSTPAAIGGAAPRPRRMSRRALFGATAAGVGAAAIGGVALTEWLQQGSFKPFAGAAASSVQTGHLLRRAGFGATMEDIATYRALGFAGAVDRLINYQQVPDDAMENRLKALNLTFDGRNGIANQQRWWLLRMAWTQRPLLEKMTLFWHGVLTSSYRKVGGAAAYGRMMVQNQFLRTHAFDSFDNILLGITSDPAMLFYLDLTKSTKNAPNENYARELMELFTLGLGHYTQQDVYQGAAALTGWHVRGRTATTAKYYPADHNDLAKTFLGHSGNLDYKDVINILTNHPATPWFICRKLFTFFAYENPTNDELSPLVDSYVKSGHNMGAVMRTLLLSPQFSSQKAYRSRVKSPVEYTVGAYRALGMQGDGTGLPYITTTMGQTLLDPPNVAGWPGDKSSALWLNSGTWMTRLNYIDLLMAGNRTLKTQAFDVQSIVDAQHIDSPEHFVDYFASFLLDGNIDTERRTQLISYFNTAGSSRGDAQVTLGNGKGYPLGRVRGTLYLMLTIPEYHLN